MSEAKRKNFSGEFKANNREETDRQEIGFMRL
jgi:hypothetical protein